MSDVSTRVKDSRMKAETLEQLIRDNPVQAVIDQKTGQPNGNFLTGPVRLSWCDTLFKPKKSDFKKKDGSEYGEQWSTQFLWPLGVDLTLISQAVTQAGMVMFPQNMTAQGFVWHGLRTPFHDQAEKSIQYSGYLPGAYYVASGTYFKPSIVDVRMNPVVDPKQVYPGCWAIGCVSPYGYSNINKGVGLGLQSLVIIGDDTNIGGGKGGNPERDFAKINVASGTNISAAFQQQVAGAVPLPGAQTQEQQMRAMGLI